MAPTKMAAFTTSKSSLIKYNKLHSKYVQVKQNQYLETKFDIQDINNTSNEYHERIANTDVPDIFVSGFNIPTTNWY
jgi:hypothetical protein